MKIVLAALAATAGAALDSSYTFEQYVAEFKKSYEPSELEHRRQVFQASLEDAISHNSDAKQTWKKAINQFSDRTPDEFRSSHGWLPSKSSGLLFEEAPALPRGFKLEDLPSEVDWRTKGVVTAIKNQGMCGSCWAFATTEVVESHVALNTTKLVELSPQNLVSCDPNPKHCGGKGGCLGSIPELAFQYIMANGLASEADWPYTSGGTSQDGECDATKKASATIDNFVKLKENDYKSVMYTLANVGPVAVNIDAIPMQAYGGGLFSGCSQSSDTHIDHVVNLVGYGTDKDLGQDYWLLRNSWGTTWGEEGYMKLLRHSTTDWCGLDIYPLDGTGCDGDDDAVNVCGSCGVLYDVSYPTGGSLV